jgi:hypothetical protein
MTPAKSTASKKPATKTTASKKTVAKKTVAKKMKMIIVRVNNVPGKMAEMLGMLAEGGIELWAHASFADEMLATVMLIPENSSKALAELEKAGLTDIKISEAIIVVARSGMKSSQAMARKIAEAGVNISYTFATSYVGGQFTTVFQTENNNAVVRALNK